VSDFELYRYTHPDGSAKEWAWCERPGVGMEVRWGRAGRLVQKAVYPPSRRREVIERALSKQRKGYRFVGWCGIDASGRPVGLHGPTGARPDDPASRCRTPRPIDKPTLPLPDLAKIETGSDDYWF
jgi:hypothetical protein